MSRDELARLAYTAWREEMWFLTSEYCDPWDVLSTAERTAWLEVVDTVLRATHHAEMESALIEREFADAMEAAMPPGDSHAS